MKLKAKLAEDYSISEWKQEIIKKTQELLKLTSCIIDSKKTWDTGQDKKDDEIKQILKAIGLTDLNLFLAKLIYHLQKQLGEQR